MNQISSGGTDAVKTVPIDATTIAQALTNDAILRRQDSPRWPCITVDGLIVHFNDDVDDSSSHRTLTRHAMPANSLADSLNSPSLSLVKDAEKMWFLKQCAEMMREEVAGQTVETVALKGKYPDFDAQTVRLRVVDDHET